MIQLQPPQEITLSVYQYAVFLAGSIEMGAAEDWQTETIKKFIDENDDLIIFNPRRDDWDSSWEQSIDNPQFRGQVQWELDAMNKADTIVMYFSPGTYSPITLLELGLYAASDKLIVCCPEGYWRKGNVDIVCAEYGIHQVESLGDLAMHIAYTLEMHRT